LIAFQPQQYTGATAATPTPNNTPNHNLVGQMLLNTLPPLTQYMLQQQQQQQQHLLTTPNLLLTPTHTPSSLGKLDPPQHQLLLGQLAGSEQLTTNNFLQSSTVTSTPIEKAATPATSAGATAGNLSAVTIKFEQDSADDEDDDKPLSSLNSCSSSGLSHTNASSEKLLLSGVHPLESTSDSLDSPSMVSGL